MKRILTLSLLILAATNLHAQGLSAGLRANAAYGLYATGPGVFKLKAVSGDHISIAPEVFLRYELEKKWAFEVSFNRRSYRPPDMVSEVYTGPRLHDTAVLKYSADYDDIAFSAQFDVLGNPAKKAGVLKKLHCYMGVTLGIMSVENENYSYYDGLSCFGPTSPPGYSYYHTSMNWFWAGVNCTTTFDLGHRFRLISAAYFKCRPVLMATYQSDAGYRYDLGAQFGLQLGAAYRIF